MASSIVPGSAIYAAPGGGQPPGYNPAFYSPYYTTAGEAPPPSGSYAYQQWVAQQAAAQRQQQQTMAATQPWNWNQSPMASYYAQPTITAPNAPTYFGPGATAQAPETTALQQMAQIDPASEALRQRLAASYATPLAQAQAPSAATLQPYLNIYRQLDPTAYAGLQALGGQVMGNVALGSTLDPITRMQIEQSVRAAQGARGNIYGTPQLVEEAMTTGQAGLALQQQREQAAQSYLQSGIAPGSVALSMYQQNLANLRAAQGGAQSYLASGVTPYQAGAGYLAAAQQAGAAASQGGPVYQPAALGSPYSYLNPAYGQQTSATGLGYFQALQNQYAQQQAMSRGGGAGGALAGGLSGALSGAVGGATLGSIVPGLGTLAGAGIGAALGGGLGAVGGYSR